MIRISRTADGSDTLVNERLDASYHSLHGAVRESNHVFIGAGLKHFISRNRPDHVRILEMGWGTGLNAWLSRITAMEHGISLSYHALESQPVPEEVLVRLNYPAMHSPGLADQYTDLHRAPWGEPTRRDEILTLFKEQADLLHWPGLPAPVDVVYYDAFSPVHQPELWTREALDLMVRSLDTDGLLVTYCAKGEVRRTLHDLGLRMERLPGPPGKREMLRGTKA